MQEQRTFTTWFGSFRKFVRQPSKRCTQRRLDLEALGERIVPTTFYWSGQGDGTSWKDSANWGSTFYPGMGGVTTDSAVINDIPPMLTDDSGDGGAPWTGVHVDMPDGVTLRSLTFGANAKYTDSITFHFGVTLTNGGSFTDSNENRTGAGNSFIKLSNTNTYFKIVGGIFTWTAGNIVSDPDQSTLNWIWVAPTDSATLRNDGAANTAQLLDAKVLIDTLATWELANQSQIVLSTNVPTIIIKDLGTMSLTESNAHGIVRSTGLDPYTTIED